MNDNTLDSRIWLHNQNRYVWLNINDIPSNIFWSVWEYIETKNVSLHSSKPLYKLH